MSRLSRWRTAIDDRLNPVMVKELRQAVQARFITNLLLLLLFLQLVILGLFLLNIEPDETDAGQAAFLFLFAVLQLAAVVLVPVFLASRITNERRGNELQLMCVTALSPVAIIAGKLLSGLLVVLLLYAAAVPFLTFTYLLRGIDLPTILVVALLSLLVAATAVQYAILVACLPVRRTLRGLLMALSLLASFYLVPFFLVMIPAQLFSGGLSVSTTDPAGLAALLTTAVILLLALIVLFSWSWAALASPAGNRALPVRLAMSVVWLVTGVVSALWADAGGDAMLPWFYLSIVVLSLAMVAGVSQRDQLGARQLRSVPHRWWLRWLVFPFASGSVPGLLWPVLMVLLTLAVLGGGALFGSWPGLAEAGVHLRIGLGIGIYGMVYALAGLTCQRRMLRQRLPIGLTWVASLLILGLLATVSVTLEILIHAGAGPPATLALWWAFSPFALHDEVAATACLVLGGPLTLLLLLVNRRWISAQVRSFVPPSEAEPSGQRP